MPNPFAPKRRRSSVPAAPAPAPAPAGLVEPSRAELDDMRKPELQALANQRGLDDSGTRADLIDRLAP